MQFSASFTSINGNTEGTIEWDAIDVGSSTLTVLGDNVPLTEGSGKASFELDGLVVIEFASGAIPMVELDPVDFPELPSWHGALGVVDVGFFP
jgi:hypothetical protein